MTRRVEDELRDLFAAIDDQIGPLPEGRSPESGRRRPVGRAVAAAVLVALLTAGAVVLARSTVAHVEVDTAGGPALVERSTFGRLTGAVCERLGRERSGVAPRFATVEAYLVSTQRHRTAIERALHELDTIPSTAGERRAIGAAVDGLEESLGLLEAIAATARAGDLEHAATLWGGVDPRVSAAFELVVERGVDRCRDI
jgi:hypothetical protein